MFRRSAILAAALVAASVGLGLPSQSVAAECEVDYCTEVETAPNGIYVLIVPGLNTDCVWNVEVDFGDGTSAEYLFEGEKGLVGSHAFPEPGVYTVTIETGEGTSATGQDCLELTIRATVVYPEPEPPEEPPKEPPPSGPSGGGGAAPAPVVAADTGIPSAWNARGAQGDSESIPYWRHCRSSVLTHRVACGKGRKVARAALAKLTQPGSARVSGFSCRLPQGGVQPIACARGEQRVLVPR